MSAPPVISALPSVPATSDPNFETLAPALFTAIKNTFISEVNAVASWINAGSWLTTPPVFDSCTILGNLTVDTSTLFVDAVNNRVGIGTSNPIDKLTVSGGGGVAVIGSQQGFTAMGTGSDLSNYEAVTIAHKDGVACRFISTAGGTGTVRPFHWATWKGSTGTDLMSLQTDGSLTVGFIGTPSARIHAVSTTEQLRLGYDASNYTRFQTNSSGDCTISPSGDGLTLDVDDIRINQTPAGAAGAATGTYARINFNGTYYKLALLADS